MKGIDVCSFLGETQLSNLATVEFRFEAVVLTEKLVFDKTYEKIGVAGSHFSTHGYTNSFVCSSCHQMNYN